MQNRFLLVIFTTLCALGLLLPAATAQTQSTTLYRWVDANGVIHFSDSPRPGTRDPAQDEYKVRAPNVSRAPRARPQQSAPPTSDPDPNAGGAAAPQGYQSLTITSPGSGETLWNIGGTLNVKVALSPGLRPGDGIIILMDGQLMTPRPATSTSIALSNVYRGEHVLVAAVRDAGGQQTIASAPIRFVVQQSTVN